jgi:hypothetical protein
VKGTSQAISTAFTYPLIPPGVLAADAVTILATAEPPSTTFKQLPQAPSPSALNVESVTYRALVGASLILALSAVHMQ